MQSVFLNWEISRSVNQRHVKAQMLTISRHTNAAIPGNVRTLANSVGDVLRSEAMSKRTGSCMSASSLTVVGWKDASKGLHN